MSDPVAVSDLTGVITTGATGLGSAGAVGLMVRWLFGKQQAEVGTRLAVIEQQLAQLVASAQKHDGLGERVALLEASMKAAHERLDGRKRR